MSKELEMLEKIANHRIEYNESYEFGITKTMPFKNTMEFKIIKQALLKTQEKYYIVYIRQYTILLNDTVVYKKHIKTNDIYHYIGKYYSQALERVERIDYQEITKEKYEGKDITYYKGEIYD